MVLATVITKFLQLFHPKLVLWNNHTWRVKVRSHCDGNGNGDSIFFSLHEWVLCKQIKVFTWWPTAMAMESLLNRLWIHFVMAMAMERNSANYTHMQLFRCHCPCHQSPCEHLYICLHRTHSWQNSFHCHWKSTWYEQMSNEIIAIAVTMWTNINEKNYQNLIFKSWSSMEMQWMTKTSFRSVRVHSQGFKTRREPCILHRVKCVTQISPGEGNLIGYYINVCVPWESN